MNQPDLLSVPECLSPRLKRISELSRLLESTKAKFNILTHCDALDEEAPWMAFAANLGETRSLGEITAQECNTVEFDQCSFYDLTERAAVIEAMRAFYPNTRELRELVELQELEEKR